MTLDTTNNAFVIAVHARNAVSGQRSFILDLNGTNSIVGSGRIVGLGNRVDPLVFPYTVDADAPRVVTITNVNNVSLYDINVQVRNVSFDGRPLNIRANGKVQVNGGIDNSNRDTGGDSGQDITVLASQIDVTTVDTRASRNPTRKSGNIRLRTFLGDTAPENLTGEIRAFGPSHLIIVDVFEAGLKPGEIRLLEPSDVGAGISFSTHKLPVRILGHRSADGALRTIASGTPIATASWRTWLL